MRTLFFIFLSIFVAPVFAAEGDDCLLAAEKSLRAADAFIARAEPDFTQNFFAESLLRLEDLSSSLQSLEKNPPEASGAEKELRSKMFELLLHVLNTGFFAVSEEEVKFLHTLTGKPSAELMAAYRNRLESCQLEAGHAAENAPKLVTRFKETELWCRPELFDNAQELLQVLYRARLAHAEKATYVFEDYLWSVAEVVSFRVWHEPHAPFAVRLALEGPMVPCADSEMQVAFVYSTHIVRFARVSFGRFNNACERSLRFLATEVPQTDAPTALIEAKTLIVALRTADTFMPGKTREARILSLMCDITEKVLVLHNLKPELYLCAIQAASYCPFEAGYAYEYLLTNVASGRREPDWTDPALALNELEKAYRWYEPHREMQVYIGEVMIKIQKLVHDTGSTEIKGKLLREAVIVLHSFHEEMADARPIK